MHLLMHAYLYNTYIYHTKQEVAPPLHLPTVKSWAFSSPGFTSKGSTLIDLVFLSRLSWPFCCFFSGDEMEKNPPGTVFKIRKQLLFFWVALAEVLLA